MRGGFLRLSFPGKKDKKSDLKDGENKKKKKVKRQPSFTLPRNPYRYQYGAGFYFNQACSNYSKNYCQVTATWGPKKKPGDGLPRFRFQKSEGDAIYTYNRKISASLDVDEISDWLNKQKVNRCVGDGCVILCLLVNTQNTIRFCRILMAILGDDISGPFTVPRSIKVLQKTKWTTFHRQHFQVNFLEWKCWNSD